MIPAPIHRSAPDRGKRLLLVAVLILVAREIWFRYVAGCACACHDDTAENGDVAPTRR